MKTLIIYFSQSGFTHKVAEQIRPGSVVLTVRTEDWCSEQCRSLHPAC